MDSWTTSTLSWPSTVIPYSVSMPKIRFIEDRLNNGSVRLCDLAAAPRRIGETFTTFSES